MCSGSSKVLFQTLRLHKGDPNHKAGINQDTPSAEIANRIRSNRTKEAFIVCRFNPCRQTWEVIKLRQPRAGLCNETTPLLRCSFELQQLVPIFVEKVKGRENVDVGDVRQELLQYINPVFQHNLKPAGEVESANLPP